MKMPSKVFFGNEIVKEQEKFALILKVLRLF
jgi:hypothetical protein